MALKSKPNVSQDLKVALKQLVGRIYWQLWYCSLFIEYS